MGMGVGHVREVHFADNTNAQTDTTRSHTHFATAPFGDRAFCTLRHRTPPNAHKHIHTHSRSHTTRPSLPPSLPLSLVRAHTHLNVFGFDYGQTALVWQKACVRVWV